jgi:hypothetical protein
MMQRSEHGETCRLLMSQRGAKCSCGFDDNRKSNVDVEFSTDFVRITLPGIRFDGHGYRTQSGDRIIETSTYEMVFALPRDCKTIQDVYKANSWLEYFHAEMGYPLKEWKYIEHYIDNYLLRKELHNLKAELNSLKLP